MANNASDVVDGAVGATSGASSFVAHVNFRVRCEKLGHGEEIFLVSESPAGGKKTVPLYTTASVSPWYHTLQPLTLPLPPRRPGKHQHSQESKVMFRYRYAVHRAGVFYRWEDPATDAPEGDGVDDSQSAQERAKHIHQHEKEVLEGAGGGGDNDVAAMEAEDDDEEESWNRTHHSLPLHHLLHRELYLVSDVLGITTGPADVEHVPVRRAPTYTPATNLLHRTAKQEQAQSRQLSSTPGLRSSSGTHLSSQNIAGGGGAQPPPSVAATARDGKKHVGFAPAPPPYRAKPPGGAPSGGGGSSSGGSGSSSSSASSASSGDGSKQTVHLNSTDGLVVVSAFLPVILHRSDETGQWTADWDYEMLLSMQTHLRVTRVGIVKWRGWHGNTGPEASPEAGVPRGERKAVEDCLKAFHCVPVWIDPALFGKMYNGFCKGVLWPVMHNVTSVYSTRPQDLESVGHGNSGGGSDDNDNERYLREQLAELQDPNHPHAAVHAQFSEYSMDDVDHGPIHGGRGKEAELWSAYNTVNRQFADVVVSCFNEGELVWIHGFHFLILPSYLTRRIPMAKVGIFLHTPFPSSEIFRTLWCREDLLRGMLNADQVGFHLFEYARHFLISCRRILGLDYGMIPDMTGGHSLAIDSGGRHVAVTSIHAGVEPPVLNQVLQHSTTVDTAAQIRNRFQGKHVCCAVDRLESLKGIPLKLLGLERFLRRCPEWQGKVVLVQVGISAFERGDDYHRTKKEVVALVHKINGQWPGTVEFQECAESKMRLQQRMALLRAADICVVTSIRDGLKLLPLEFTICHQDAMTELGRKDGRKRGICILSEFASCTRVMRGALHVNPWKISEIARAFYQALHMSEEERLRRISIASEFVTRVTTQRWALAVMLDLKGVHKNVNPVQYSGAGLGLGYRLLGMDTGFVSLDTNVVAKAYRNSKARLILLDYGGTIVNNDNLDNLLRFQMVKERSAPSAPTDAMIYALQGLCADKRNTVFVVSGKERHSLTRSKLGGIPNLGLAAEHGMFISWPTSSSGNKNTTTKRRWETLVPETDRQWRQLAVNLMEVYTSRTHGSYIEETEMKVLWQYRDADTEFGFLQAKELEDHLAKYLRSFPVDILHGGIEEGGYVEVRPKGVNKGVLAMRAVRRFPDVAQKDRVDFCLVLGDDHCDEPMLSVMRQVGRRSLDARRAAAGQDPLPEMPATIQLVDVSQCDPYVTSDLQVFTATVGKKPSAAAHYLHDVDEVQALLEGLVKVSAREQRSYSLIDLQSQAASAVIAGFSMDDSSGQRSTSRWSTGMTKSLGAAAGAGVAGMIAEAQGEGGAASQGWLGQGTIEDEDDEGIFI